MAERSPDTSGPPPSPEMHAPEPPPTAFLPVVPPEPARERRALGVLAIAAIAAMVWITHPVGIGILLGALNAFVMQPFHERLRSRGRRPSVVAAIVVGLSSLAIVAVLVGLSSLLVDRGMVLAELVVGWTRRLELAWRALVVVGISDYVIRPRLVGRGGSVPALFTFAALFGGWRRSGWSGS